MSAPTDTETEEVAADPRRAAPGIAAAAPAMPVRFPPGVAGKRRKPWLARRRALRGTVTAMIDLASAHLPEVVDLWVESWRRTLPHIDFDARRGWLVDHLEEARAKGAVVRLAVVGTGEIAGFVLIDPASGYLDQIAVHPEFWGGGVAEVLLDEARRWSPQRIVLDVNADNPRAVAFYVRQGFGEIGRGVNPRSGLATLKLEWRAGETSGT
ncbi:MAG: GNAT family N-acetyltransferase [Siculibacillus sp.]|nr:GNAT family N-acetyltransferase [Siculibacillus sp.]